MADDAPPNGHLPSPDELPAPDSPTQPTTARTQSSLLATLLLGGSSVAGIVAGIVRQKTVAVVLGPAGVGLLGQLSTLMALVATAAGLGAGQSGVRSVAIAQEDGPRSLTRTASALIWSSHALGIVGGLLVLALPLGEVLGSEGAPFRPWLAVGVWAIIASVGHTALINGMGRLRLLAGVGTAGAVLSTVVVVVAIQAGAYAGIAASLVASPLVGFGLAAWWGRAELLPLIAGWRQWRGPLRALLSVGIAFMGSALLGGVMHFVTRLMVGQSLGTDAAGLYHASWSIAGLYLSFLLTALAGEYYPRISALSGNEAALSQAVRDQTQLSVCLVVPFVLFAVVASPLVIKVLYDSRFVPMLPMLRAQLTGDVLKTASWAIAFSLMATRHQLRYFVAEAAFTVIYTSAIFFVVPTTGLVAAGWAYAGCYLVYLVLVVAFVRGRVSGLGWPLAQVASYTTVCAGVAWACSSGNGWVWGLGAAGAVATSAVALRSIWVLAGGQWSRVPVLGKLARLRRPS